MSRLGVGLVGCGVMGRSLGSQLLTLEEARLAGVADADPAAAAEAARELGAPAFPDAASLLDAPGVDAVLIALPGFLHRPVTEMAAARGRHVFVEKPMATNTADCDAMIAACERAGVTLMVGQVLRYIPCFLRILELVREGAIGVPWGIDVTRIGGGFSGIWARSWRNSLERSGGVLMEVNAHEIDFMRQVCGEVVQVYAETGSYGEHEADYPNLYFVSLRFAGGAIGMLHSSHVSALGESSGKVQGSEGTILYHGGFNGGEIRWARRGEERQVIPYAAIETEQPVRRELRLFVEAALRGTPPPVTGRDARQNVLVAEAAYASARSGGPVSLREGRIV